MIGLYCFTPKDYVEQSNDEIGWRLVTRGLKLSAREKTKSGSTSKIPVWPSACPIHFDASRPDAKLNKQRHASSRSSKLSVSLHALHVDHSSLTDHDPTRCCPQHVQTISTSFAHQHPPSRANPSNGSGSGSELASSAESASPSRDSTQSKLTV